jgi:hypothetical protein
MNKSGVALLLAIGAKKPEFLLTGKTLQDQGAVVANMLAAGWTEGQLYHVVASRPLPQPVKTSVGAIVAGRLREAAASPPPSSVPHQVQRAAGDVTPTPASLPEMLARTESLKVVECVGWDGMCGRPVEAGSNLCRHCCDANVNV